MSEEDERALESALADVQLLGSGTQVQLAREFALDFARKGNADLDELLESLRRDLRRELDLGSVSDRVVHLRIERAATDPQTSKSPE